MDNPFDPGYYDEDALRGFGFRSVGRDVRVARNATIIGLPHISLGDHVRIDGYTTLLAGESGPLVLGSHIHIGAGCYIAAGAGVQIGDFGGLSQGVRIYSRSDDYSGAHLTNPTVPARYLGIHAAPVRLGRHVIVGTGSVILPGCTLEEGCAVGALSLVTRSLAAWTLCAGAPARRVSQRSRRALELEAQLRAEQAAQAE
jgi:acetyltransferase-like isoleucine patch superfamily enzyme